MFNRKEVIGLMAAAFATGALSTAGAAIAFGKLAGYPAAEMRLIGRCDGRIMGAMEEDQFPASGCEWIEPIRYSEESRNGGESLRLGESR